jgi:prepilin-type N-terminal cleavage/methylation domain-containing protein
MNPTQQPRRSGAACYGFSLIELLLVIAIIGVMSALVIASFSNATQDSRRVLVLQQQAVLQEALNSWIARESSIIGTGSLASAKAAYDLTTTGLAKLALLDDYLDPSTAGQFVAHASVSNALNSDVMEKTGQYITFSTWPTGGYPKVDLNP